MAFTSEIVFTVDSMSIPAFYEAVPESFLLCAPAPAPLPFAFPPNGANWTLFPPLLRLILAQHRKTAHSASAAKG